MELKWPGLETDHSLHTETVEFKNEWSYTSTPLYAFIACTGPTDGLSEDRYLRPGPSQQ